MKKPELVIVVPCKANIMDGVGMFCSIQATFSPLLERLRTERQVMSCMLVFCCTYNMCADLFAYFKLSHGNDFTEPPNSVEVNKHGLANIFLGCTPPDVKAEIIHQFTGTDTLLRLLFATSAFGMGVDCCNVQQIIHVGITEDTESYIQATGRHRKISKSQLNTPVWSSLLSPN